MVGWKYRSTLLARGCLHPSPTQDTMPTDHRPGAVRFRNIPIPKLRVSRKTRHDGARVTCARKHHIGTSCVCWQYGSARSFLLRALVWRSAPASANARRDRSVVTAKAREVLRAHE